MKLFSRVAGVVGCTILLAVSLFAGGASEADTINMKIYTAYPPGDESYVTAMEFAERVEKYSEGSITAEVFHSGSMGGEKETVQAVKLGDAQGVTSGLLPVTMFTQDYAFFDGIYVFKDFNHFKNVWDGKLGKEIQDILLENNLRSMGVYLRGMRNLSANIPIKIPEDGKGLKIRTPQLPSMVNTWKELGFLPTPIALPELFTSLQTGVVDCAEGPPSQMLSYKYQEVQDYLMFTGHNVSVAMFLLSERFLDSLDADKRAIVEKAAEEAVAAGAEFALKADKEKLDKLIAGGMTPVEVDKDAFMKKARPAVENLFKTQWNVTNVDEILSYMK
jgi:TRAP-type transport system periplasmic protein